MYKRIHSWVRLLLHYQCSVSLFSPSSLTPLCSEWFWIQFSLLSLFSLILHSIQPHTIVFRMVLQPIQPFSLFIIVLHSIHPHTILFRMVLKPIQPHVTVQPDCAVHPASYHCVQNSSASNTASCHCSAWLCSPSSLIPLCSEWSWIQSRLLSLFSLIVQSIQPHNLQITWYNIAVCKLEVVQRDISPEKYSRSTMRGAQSPCHPYVFMERNLHV